MGERSRADDKSSPLNYSASTSVCSSVWPGMDMEYQPLSSSSGRNTPTDMADGAEGVSGASSSAHLLDTASPLRISPLLSPSRSHHTLSNSSHIGLVMSSRPPRLQPVANGKAPPGKADVAAPNPTPAPTLDPIHRQKIMQLRLAAAKASQKRQRSLRRENIHRLAFWLVRTSLWLAGIFSLTVLVVAFPLAVDPAWESIWRMFSSSPVICLTTDIQIQHSRNPDGSVKGNDACTWTSCRQGCTGELFRCVQVFANISRLPWEKLESANTSRWVRLDSPQIELARRHKRASTNWAVSWATQNKHLFNKSSNGNQSIINPMYEIQRDHSRRQFVRLMEELGHLGEANDTGQPLLFEATNVRLMVNVRGCGYTVDCAEFHRTAGVIGSLIPCHLSSRGDVTVAVIDHNPEQDRNIILFLFTVPACIFSSAVFLLCCIHYQCCRPQCANFFARRSSAEYSVARLAINTGQLGGQLPSLKPQQASVIKYWAAPTEETTTATVDRAAQQLPLPLQLT